MKAIVSASYGHPDLVELKEVAKPVPKDNEVLVKVLASSVNTRNMIFVTGKPFFVRLMGAGLLEPKVRIPGNDLAGVVESVGKDVKQFRPGDEVFGDSSGCGFGAYAEYLCTPESALVRKPANMTFEEAAGVSEAALVALQGLRDKGRVQKGEKVLIYGASGGIGTYAVQLAKYFGADVTGVCSTRNKDLVRSLGADHVLDYTQEKYPPDGTGYDLIFAIPFRPISDHLQALGPKGRYVSTGSPYIPRILQDMLLGPSRAKKEGKSVIGGWTVEPKQADLEFLKGLIADGRLRTAIDRRFPLRDTAQAFRYYGEGHSRGKVIITMGE